MAVGELPSDSMCVVAILRGLRCVRGGCGFLSLNPYNRRALVALTGFSTDDGAGEALRAYRAPAGCARGVKPTRECFLGSEARRQMPWQGGMDCLTRLFGAHRGGLNLAEKQTYLEDAR